MSTKTSRRSSGKAKAGKAKAGKASGKRGAKRGTNGSNSNRANSSSGGITAAAMAAALRSKLLAYATETEPGLCERARLEASQLRERDTAKYVKERREKEEKEQSERREKREKAREKAWKASLEAWNARCNEEQEEGQEDGGEDAADASSASSSSSDEKSASGSDAVPMTTDADAVHVKHEHPQQQQQQQQLLQEAGSTVELLPLSDDGHEYGPPLYYRFTETTASESVASGSSSNISKHGDDDTGRAALHAAFRLQLQRMQEQGLWHDERLCVPLTNPSAQPLSPSRLVPCADDSDSYGLFSTPDDISRMTARKKPKYRPAYRAGPATSTSSSGDSSSENASIVVDDSARRRLGGSVGRAIAFDPVTLTLRIPRALCSGRKRRKELQHTSSSSQQQQHQQQQQQQQYHQYTQQQQDGFPAPSPPPTKRQRVEAGLTALRTGGVPLALVPRMLQPLSRQRSGTAKTGLFGVPKPAAESSTSGGSSSSSGKSSRGGSSKGHHDRVMWTPEEDTLLQLTANELGRNWRLLAHMLHSSPTVSGRLRSPRDCMHRYNLLQHHSGEGLYITAEEQAAAREKEKKARKKKKSKGARRRDRHAHIYVPGGYGSNSVLNAVERAMKSVASRRKQLRNALRVTTRTGRSSGHHHHHFNSGDDGKPATLHGIHPSHKSTVTTSHERLGLPRQAMGKTLMPHQIIQLRTRRLKLERDAKQQQQQQQQAAAAAAQQQSRARSQPLGRRGSGAGGRQASLGAGGVGGVGGVGVGGHGGGMTHHGAPVMYAAAGQQQRTHAAAAYGGQQAHTQPQGAAVGYQTGTQTGYAPVQTQYAPVNTQQQQQQPAPSYGQYAPAPTQQQMQYAPPPQQQAQQQSQQYVPQQQYTQQQQQPQQQQQAYYAPAQTTGVVGGVGTGSGQQQVGGVPQQGMGNVPMQGGFDNGMGGVQAQQQQHGGLPILPTGQHLPQQ